MRWPHLSCRTQRGSRRRLRFEPLEDRRLMAELAIGVTLVGVSLDDPSDTTIDVGNVGDEFSLQIRVQDLRNAGEAAAGVITLPLHISWDPNFVTLVADPVPGPIPLGSPLLTDAFPLQRFLTDFDPAAGPAVPAPPPTPADFIPFANLQGLRGAALPNAGFGVEIGMTEEDVFSELRFRSLAATNGTPFTIRLAGSMSFADAAALDRVATGSNTETVNADDLITVQTNLVIESPPLPPGNNSVSGFVFADTNLDGIRDAGEDGLPNVEIQLVRTDAGGSTPVTTLTGPDGWYHFESVEAGIYDVIEIQPAGFVNASISLGLVFPTGSMQPSDSDRGTTEGFNAFRGIDLSGGGNAVDFNFGDNIVPTKRRFVVSVDPFAETCAQLGLSCVTVRGTEGNDQIDFTPDTDVVSVTVNDQPAQVFSRDTVNIVKIDALAGEDTVTLLGSSADDVAHFQSNACTIQTGAYRPNDYAVLAVNAERTIADGLLGNDQVVLRDSTVDDVLTATNDPFIGPVTELESALDMARFARAVAFERTRAVSIPRDGISETDTATLNGLAIELVGKWQTTVQP